MSGPRLPRWLVIGAAKSGTTSLAYWLAEHPDLFVAYVKEVHFFDRDHTFAEGVDSYSRHFSDAADHQLPGEATPDYLWDPVVPERVHAVLPSGTPLVALLRHPVERAYSHYWHARSWGGDLPDFLEVAQRAVAGDPRLAHYVTRGHYATQLARYDDLGRAPLVLLTEELQDDPFAAFSRVCRHLGVEPIAVAGLGTVHNASHRRRSQRLRREMERVQAWRWAPRTAQRIDALNTRTTSNPPLVGPARELLLEHYAPHNELLRARLGLPLSAWDS